MSQMKVHASRRINSTVIKEKIIMYTQRRLGLWRLSHAVLILNYQLDWMIVLNITQQCWEPRVPWQWSSDILFPWEYSSLACNLNGNNRPLHTHELSRHALESDLNAVFLNFAHDELARSPFTYTHRWKSHFRNYVIELYGVTSRFCHNWPATLV